MPRSAIFSCLLFALFGSVQAFGSHGATKGVQSKVVANRGSGGYQVLRGGNGAAPSLWGRYLHALETRPMPTKLVTAAVLSGTGDLIAQAMVTSAPFAMKRLLTLVAVNVFYIVPILSAFYAANEALARYLKLEQAAQWKRTAVQLGFDQLVNAPIVVGGFFCAFQLATAVADALTGVTLGMPGASALLATMREQLTSSWASTVVTNWQVWVLPQLFNFAFIPPWGRVAFANVVALVWNVILSAIANE
jgi:peroxisomal membrane protein 2